MTAPTPPLETEPDIADTRRRGSSRPLGTRFGAELVLVPAGLVLLGTLLFILGTRWGIGIRPDSVVYLGLADTGVAHAPLYTLIIGTAQRWGGSAVQVAWWCNLLLMLANVLLMWRLLRVATWSATSALLGTLAILLLPIFLYMHETAFSDGLFLLLVLLFMVSTTSYLETGRRLALAGGGLATALAMLTRFAGFPLLGVGLIAILLFGRGSWRARVLDGLMFLALGIGLFVAWLIGDMLQGGEGTGRELALLGNPTIGTFLQGFDALSSFLVPTRVASPVRALLLVGVVAGLAVVAIAYLRRNWRPADAAPLAMLPHVGVLFIAGYASFLILSVFIEANLPFQARYLAPLFVASVLVITIGLKGRAAPAGLARRAKVVGVLAVALIAANSARAAKQTWTQFREGNFYASPEWYASPTLQHVRELDPKLAIYTNAPDAVTFLTGKPSLWIPRKFERRTGKDDPARPYEARLRELAARLRESGAVVVHLKRIDFRFYLPDERELVDALALEPLFSATDGTVYRHRDALVGEAPDVATAADQEP